MKKVFMMGLMTLSVTLVSAQTSKEIIGKWQLVKWQYNGQNQDIASAFKTDKVYQIFLNDNKFQSQIGDKINDGKWSLSKENTEIEIVSNNDKIKFHIDYFDKNRRVISSDQLGTMEYKKVQN